jgi:hypothetical protein
MENQPASDYSIMRIISQYNHNQGDYHQNMASLINILQEQQRQQQQPSRSNEIYTFEFGVSDAANALLSLFDPSGVGSTAAARSGLSVADISNGTVVMNYETEETPLVCPITLEQVQVGEPIMRINRCRHRFKEAALRRWFENHQRCPLCRGRIQP